MVILFLYAPYKKMLWVHTKRVPFKLLINAVSQAGLRYMGGISMKEEISTALPRAALDEIPTPGADAVSITGLVKSEGRISGYQLSDERIVSREEGVSLAKAGKIKGVGIAHNKDTEYLKSIPDDSEGNNLSSLPTVKTEAF